LQQFLLVSDRVIGEARQACCLDDAFDFLFIAVCK
jgi:hypothetical protein